MILDSDVAELYGVETKRVNEAVSNNPEKFPEGYVWVLNGTEKNEVVENFDHLHKLKFSPQFPKAFTEKGLYMLATILKSPKAVETTIAIVEAYAKLRELSRVMAKKRQRYPLFWLMRFTTTFTITSFSSGRLSAIISVKATKVLSAMRLRPSAA